MPSISTLFLFVRVNDQSPFHSSNYRCKIHPPLRKSFQSYTAFTPERNAKQRTRKWQQSVRATES